MKTQNSTLSLNKRSVVELNTEQLQNVNGGTTVTLIGTTSLIMLTLVTK